MHDLTVIGNATALGGLVREAAGTVLVNSGRPLLLIPAKAPRKIGTSVAIAWKPSPEATRAVAAAMPLLAAARRVTIVSIAEDEDETASDADALAASLRWHGINAEISYMAHPAGSIHDTIVRTAADAKADLLVMGAYGHSRLSEFVFGGFTRHILGGAAVPTLLTH